MSLFQVFIQEEPKKPRKRLPKIRTGALVPWGGAQEPTPERVIKPDLPTGALGGPVSGNKHVR